MPEIDADQREKAFERDREEMKSFRLEQPSGWIHLTRHEGVQLIVDALLDAGSHREFNKSELAEFAGVSRQTVQNHIETLVDLDVVDDLDRGFVTRYRFVPDSPVSRAIIELNTAVNLNHEESPERDRAVSECPECGSHALLETEESTRCYECDLVVEESRSDPESYSSTSDARETPACPNCDSENVVATTDRGLVCEDCGSVLDDRNDDPGPTWRAFNHSERQSESRVDAPTETIHDAGLTTTIDWKDIDAYGRSISSKERSQMHWLRKWRDRIRTEEADDDGLQFALAEIDRMTSALGAPRVVSEVASVIYRRALNEDLIRDRSIEAVSAAALYAACRAEGIPRSLEDISAVSRTDREAIDRTYRYVSRELGLETDPVDPRKYVPRFASELDLGEEAQSKADEMIETAAERGLLSEESPAGVAAAAIYAASLLCNEEKTQREVADVARITEATVRDRYQELIEASSSGE